MDNVMTDEFRVMATYRWSKESARFDLLHGYPAGSVNYTLKSQNIHTNISNGIKESTC